MANTSFEEYTGCATNPPSVYHLLPPLTGVFGWKTTQPAGQVRCDGQNTGATARVIEIHGVGLHGYTPNDGANHAELNAYNAGMLYQSLCLANGETFNFEFAHRPVGNRIDIAEFRLGVPTGLDAGSVSADSYSRSILRVTTTQAGGIVTGVAQTSYDGTTALEPQVSPNKWGVYAGSHTLPNSGWSGVFNVGFVGIQSAGPSGGNVLDSITLGLSPLIDMGSTRDTSASEGSAPAALKIRVNGRVGPATTIALFKATGTATSDSDFSLGTPSTKYGTAPVTHVNGSNLWLITIPQGDYDGGVNPDLNAGGLIIPINYIYDQVSEASEWAHFVLLPDGDAGASTNWKFADPHL